MLKSILWHFLFLAITFLSSVTLHFIIPKRIKLKSHIKISRVKNIRLVLSRCIFIWIGGYNCSITQPKNTFTGYISIIIIKKSICRKKVGIPRIRIQERLSRRNNCRVDTTLVIIKKAMNILC